MRSKASKHQAGRRHSLSSIRGRMIHQVFCRQPKAHKGTQSATCNVKRVGRVTKTHCWVLHVNTLCQKGGVKQRKCPKKTISKHCQRQNGPEGWVHITESRLSINFKISTIQFNFITSTKHQHQNAEQTPASKSCLNFNFKILTNPCAQSLNKSLALWPNVSFKSATNCCQHDAHHQHQQQ